jgi:hypothetical protein
MPRPSFRPTPEQRKLVRSLAAVGLRQEWICQMLHLRSPKTLRKHFPEELSKGLAEATAAVARTAYEMALSGRYPAMLLFWAEVPSSRWSAARNPTRGQEVTTFRGNGCARASKRKGNGGQAQCRCLSFNRVRKNAVG